MKDQLSTSNVQHSTSKQRLLLPARSTAKRPSVFDREGFEKVASDLLDAFSHIKEIDYITIKDRDNLEALATLVINKLHTLEVRLG